MVTIAWSRITSKDVFRKALELAYKDMVRLACMCPTNDEAWNKSCEEMFNDLDRYLLERGLIVSVDEKGNLIKCIFSVVPGLPPAVQGSYNASTIECEKVGRTPILYYHTHPANVIIHSSMDIFLFEPWGWMCVGRNSRGKAKIVCFFVTPDNIGDLARVSDKLKYLIGPYVKQKLCIVPIEMLTKLSDDWWIKLYNWVEATEDLETFKRQIIKEIRELYKCILGFPIAVFREKDAEAIEQVFIEYLDKMKREGKLPEYIIIEEPCQT